MPRDRFDDVGRHLCGRRSAQILQLQPHPQIRGVPDDKQIFNHRRQPFDGGRVWRCLELLEQLAMIGSEQIVGRCCRIGNVARDSLDELGAFIVHQLAQILDDDESSPFEIEPLDLRALVPDRGVATKRDPNFAAMIGLTVPGGAGDDLRQRGITAKIGEKFCQKLRWQCNRYDLVALQSPLDRFVIHIIVGGNWAVIPQKSNPSRC